MLKKLGAVVLGTSVLLLCACGGQKTPTINNSMTKIMQPDAQTIWDITSAAFNAKGDGLVAEKISDADWAKLKTAAAEMRDRAQILANARPLVVAGPGETILGQDSSRNVPSDQVGTWDAASPTQIKAWIDANPTLFSQRAQILADAMDSIVKAAPTKDAAALYKVSAGLDETCDGCHQKFWGTDDPPPFPKLIAPPSAAPASSGTTAP